MGLASGLLNSMKLKLGKFGYNKSSKSHSESESHYSQDEDELDALYEQLCSDNQHRYSSEDLAYYVMSTPTPMTDKALDLLRECLKIQNQDLLCLVNRVPSKSSFDIEVIWGQQSAPLENIEVSTSSDLDLQNNNLLDNKDLKIKKGLSQRLYFSQLFNDKLSKSTKGDSWVLITGIAGVERDYYSCKVYIPAHEEIFNEGKTQKVGYSNIEKKWTDYFYK